MLIESLAGAAVLFALLVAVLRARAPRLGSGTRDPAALAGMKAALARSPGDVPLMAKVAKACLESGDLDGAQRHFRGLLLQPLDACPFTKAEIFYHLAETSRLQGERARALRLLQRALEADPTLVAAQQLQATLAPRDY